VVNKNRGKSLNPPEDGPPEVKFPEDGPPEDFIKEGKRGIMKGHGGRPALFFALGKN
jgi:hypothetical protein